MFRGEEYVALGTSFKNLVAEDLAGFKNALRMDSEQFNEQFDPCSTLFFSVKGLLCRTTLVWIWSISAQLFIQLTCFVPFASVDIFEAFQVFAQCFRIAKIYVILKQLFH